MNKAYDPLQKKKRFRMKRIHVLSAFLVLTIILAVVFWPRSPGDQQAARRELPPGNWLTEKYGPKKYSQNNEELIIRDFFEDRTNGFFVDIGASHYRTNSTTYYLEKHLGWKGIAVDALRDYEKDYSVHRKNTLFFCYYIGDKSDEEIDFYVNAGNKRVSTSDSALAKAKGKFEKIRIPTISLNDLLQKEGITTFDFLSMDIELAEPAALAGFSIRKYRPALVCIEAHPQVRDQIGKYFQANDYTVIEKYRGLDPLNLYFTPAFKR